MSHPITATAYMPPPEVRTGIPIPTHNHDGRYYTKEESNLSMVAEAEARESGDVALGDDIDELVLVVDDKADKSTLTAHTSNTSNPHSVTKTQVGLSNVDNTSDANKPVSTAQQTALDLKANATDLTSHTSSTSNPHGVTKAQVGLASVDDTSDNNKPVSIATQAALDLKADLSTVEAECVTSVAMQVTVDSDSANFGLTWQFVGGDGGGAASPDWSIPLANEGGSGKAGLMSAAQVASLAGKADTTSLTAHTTSTSNPHGVTAAQVGAETSAQLNGRDTANRSRANHTGTQAQSTIEGLELDLADKAAASALAAHVADTGNPHGVTSAQIGAVASNVTGIPGAIQITNHIAISAEDYNAIAVPDPNTIYEIIA